jgi:hypothetical protein
MHFIFIGLLPGLLPGLLRKATHSTTELTDGSILRSKCSGCEFPEVAE